MAITQIANYTPTDRRPQAFSLSSPAALEINNQTTMRLVVFVSRTLRDVLAPGDHKVYTGLNNLAVAPTFLLVQPDDVPDSAMLSGFLTVTSYGSVNDALPAQGSYSPGTFTVPSLTVQDRSSLTRTLASVRLADFAPDPLGFVDAQPQIQAALDVARVMGGGLVYDEGGTYLLASCPVHPVDNTINSCLVMGSGTCLRGAGAGRTVLKFGPNVGNQARMITNYNRTVGTQGDTDMAIEDLTLDGQAAAQTGNIDAQVGANYRYARRVAYRRVVARDIYGTVSGGNGPFGTPGEGAMLSTNFCADVTYTDCTVYDSGVNKTASGISNNSGTGIEVKGCKAYGLTFSRGFTHWHCNVVQYVNCHSYLMANTGIGGEGFNSEFSGSVTYVNCTSGGGSSDQSGFPFNANTNLGNASHGFRVDNAIGRHVFNGCNSIGNTQSGVAITNGGSGLFYDFIGGFYSGNQQYGIDLDSAGGPLARFTGFVGCTGNIAGQLRYDGTHATSVFTGLTAPAVPGSGASFPNPFPFAVMIKFNGGTMTNITVDGVSVATATPGYPVLVAPQRAIVLTYSVAPTWQWYTTI